MAETYGFNITDLSDLDQAAFSEIANLGFRNTAVWRAGVSTSRDHSVRMPRGQKTVTVTKPGGFTIPTSAYTPGAAMSYTTPTETQVSMAWATYPAAVQIDQTSQRAGIIDLVGTSIAKWVRVARETYEYVAATAAVAGTDTDQIAYVGQSARASIEATDTITKAYVDKAVAQLRANSAPPFFIPGLPGPVYIGFIHPHVAYDLKAESSGIMTGPVNVDGPNYRLNALGVHCGVLWFETPSGTPSQSAVLAADAGSSNVDVYKTVIVADESFGYCNSMVEQAGAVARDIRIDEDGAIVGRITQPGTNLGLITEVGFIANIGFKILEEEGIYRIESASSLGANT